MIVHEHRGEPDGLVVCHLPYGPTCSFGVMNAVLRHDLKDANLGTVSEAFPHLIFHNFRTPLGERVANCLKYLFPVSAQQLASLKCRGTWEVILCSQVPKPESHRVMTFVNENDYISFRHHVYTKKGKEVDLREVGPRFDLKLYQVPSLPTSCCTHYDAHRSSWEPSIRVRQRMNGCYDRT